MVSKIKKSKAKKMRPGRQDLDKISKNLTQGEDYLLSNSQRSLSFFALKRHL